MVGCHKRVGELVKRDEPITVPQLKAIDLLLINLWALEWNKPEGERNYQELREVAMMGLWFLGGFCTGLRGEEMILLELKGTTKSLSYLKTPGEFGCPHTLNWQCQV